MFEVGAVGRASFVRPADSDKAWRVVGSGTVGTAEDDKRVDAESGFATES